MRQLKTQITRLQHKAYYRWLESSLALLTLMVLQSYQCLIILVLVVPFYLLYYVPPTLTRLLYQMVFPEKFALFRFGRENLPQDQISHGGPSRQSNQLTGQIKLSTVH